MSESMDALIEVQALLKSRGLDVDIDQIKAIKVSGSLGFTPKYSWESKDGTIREYEPLNVQMELTLTTKDGKQTQIHWYERKLSTSFTRLFE